MIKCDITFFNFHFANFECLFHILNIKYHLTELPAVPIQTLYIENITSLIAHFTFIDDVIA